jgi:phenylpropionate dioxygenase-like ring-hydroxylating dioxygenase large terminal subunit
VVVDDEKGHCSAFRCPYHFWVYSLEGELVGIPQEEAYDGTGFEKDNFPLVEIDCEAVLGLVFVNLSDEHDTLEEWLGPEVVDVLSTPLALGDFDVCAAGITDDLPVNWKIFAENARDGYHVPFVHPFLRKASPPGEYHLFANGHAVQYLGVDREGMGADWERVAKYTFPGVETGEGWIVTLFPDICLMMRWNMLSIDYQRILSPSHILMENRTLGLKTDTEEIREVRRLNQSFWFANPLEHEDAPVFMKQQRGVAARKVRYSIIARGADATTGTRGDDNRLRWFWAAWRELTGLDQSSLEEL